MLTVIFILLAFDPVLGARVKSRLDQSSLGRHVREPTNDLGDNETFHGEHPAKLLGGRDRRKNHDHPFFDLYRGEAMRVNHVAAYIITDKGRTVLQNIGSWHTLGGYVQAQSLPYKLHALRAEMLDEGNVVVTKDNLIRASPLYLKWSAPQKTVLLQVFYLKEDGSWENNLMSHERVRLKQDPNIVHAIPLVDELGNGIEDYLWRRLGEYGKSPTWRQWRPCDRDSYTWLKDNGVFDDILDSAKTAEMFLHGALQTFDDTLQEQKFFQIMQSAIEKPEVKDLFESIVKSAWEPLPRDGGVSQNALLG